MSMRRIASCVVILAFTVTLLSGCFNEAYFKLTAVKPALEYLEKKYPDQKFEWNDGYNYKELSFIAEGYDRPVRVYYRTSTKCYSDNFQFIRYEDELYEFFEPIASAIAGDDHVYFVYADGGTNPLPYDNLPFDEFLDCPSAQIKLRILIPVESADVDRGQWEEHVFGVLDQYDICLDTVQIQYVEDYELYEEIKSGERDSNYVGGRSVWLYAYYGKSREWNSITWSERGA